MMQSMSDSYERVDTVVPEGVLAAWEVAGATVKRGLMAPGSPERCVRRWVLRHATQGLMVLERLHLGQERQRLWVAKLLHALEARGMNRLPALIRTRENTWLHEHDSSFWQLSRFVPGNELPRPGYVNHAGRGECLAAFLVDLRSHAAQCTLENAPSPVPSLPGYVQDICSMATSRGAEYSIQIQRLGQAYEQLHAESETHAERFLCHGDFHPLNVIWQGQDVMAVIDWEFAGMNEQSYDMANLLGCVGIEDPQALVGPLALAFVQGLGRGGIFEREQIDQLLTCMFGLRFGWLSEWLRRGDRDMQELEIRYMNLLLDNRRVLRRAWLDQLKG